MSISFNEKFDVLETFEENANQKILMGTSKENPEEVVVINEFLKSGALPADLGSLLQSSLTNLLHFEESDSNFIVVTKYNEGMPLSNFLESYDPTLDGRINFAFEYLNKIVKYDIFNNYFKSILINENQLIIKDNELIINELLILDDTIPSDLSFDKISNRIGDVIDKIISVSDAPKDDKKLMSLLSFIAGLKAGNQGYKSIISIYEKFRQLYIYDMYLDNGSSDGSGGIAAVVPIPVGSSNGLDKNTPTETPDSLPKEEPPVQPEQEIVATATPESTDPAVDQNPSDNILDEDARFDELYNSAGQDEDEDEPEKKRKLSPLALIALAVILLTGSVYIIYKIFDKDEIVSQTLKPIAKFEIQRLDDNTLFCENKSVASEGVEIVKSQWRLLHDGTEILSLEDTDLTYKLAAEGNYTITLTVTGSNELTDSYTEDYIYTIVAIDENDTKDTDGDGNADGSDDDKNGTNGEKLNKYSLTFDDNISEDYEVARSGTKSLKIDLTEKSSAKITISKLKINANSTVSFWLMSDSLTPVSITMTGYNGDSKIFSKDITHSPNTVNKWELVERTLKTSLVDRIELTFTSKGATLWFDDLAIGSYK